MDIRTALTALTVIQKSLHIDDPAPGSDIVRAWPYVPPQAAALETPCFLNSWTMLEEAPGPSKSHQTYVVHMQLMCQNADLDVGYDEATAFHVALVDALHSATGYPTLGGTVSSYRLRGGDPTLAALEFGGKAYPGLNLFLTLQMIESKEFGA